MWQRHFVHDDRAAARVSVDVPARPFTRSAFRAHLMAHARFVDDRTAAAELDGLVADGTVLKLGPNIEMWIGAADLHLAIEDLDAALMCRAAALAGARAGRPLTSSDGSDVRRRRGARRRPRAAD